MALTLELEDKSSESRKAEHVKNQVALWDKILESRIKYNKILLCDKLDPKTLDSSAEIDSLKSNVQNLMQKLIEIQNELFKKNEKLSDLANQKSRNYRKTLVERFDKFKVYRNEILNKWEKRVRLYSLNNQQSVNMEVDILTKINTLTSKNQTGDNNKFHTFLKNDQEFYASLIKELIERKGVNMNLAKQIKSGKVKKLVDTKSSKGRKIRYVLIVTRLNMNYVYICLSVAPITADGRLFSVINPLALLLFR